MKKYGKKSVVVMMLFVLLFSSIYSVNSYAATKKPAQVNGLKKVKNGCKCKWDGHRNVSSVKISFKKVKGATGYQVLIYQGKVKGYATPLVYAKETKKTTYTIKNLVPDKTHIIKVRAYKKGKDGKIAYGKTTSIKVKTSGQRKGCYYTCGTCIAVMPANDYRIAEHGKSTDKIGELHAGGSIFWE